MAEPSIVFDHVWKKFRRGEVYDSLRDLIPAVARRIIRRTAGDRTALQKREFWALGDVSFEVRTGEALAIIGSNGAGKSTALKTLNRILRPTRGRCEVHGRAGSLIEVAAGFHQDLTGRQNVFLQGAIMGMRRDEIERKFDDIVDFSGISEFIDTPVKRYSSGMNARLGFAIAAHLDPEVLIIDEVLAVGDAAFQNRAYGRIKEMVRSGVPVVLVSHQLDRVSELCTKAIVLERGRVVRSGTPTECIAAYLETSVQPVQRDDEDCAVVLEDLQLCSDRRVRSGGHVRYRLSGTVRDGAHEALDPFYVRIRSVHTGAVMFRVLGSACGLGRPAVGEFAVDVELQLNVPPGVYALETQVFDNRTAEFAARGPSVYVEVVQGVDFWGPVQMNPQMTLVAASAFAVTANV